jgi:hypothetical protein
MAKPVITAVIFVLTLATSACANSGELPQNRLNCTTLGPGTLTQVTVAGHVSRPLTITSARLCSWSFLSAYTQGQPVQYWQDPPAVVVLRDGSAEDLPGSDEYVFVAAASK